MHLERGDRMTIIAQSLLANPNKILRHINEQEPIYTYLAGSTMEGFGNKTSDVDVYVICEKIPTSINKNEDNVGESILSDDYSLIHNIIYEGVRYDFEYWELSNFNKLVKQLNELNFKTDDYIPRFSDSEFDLLHRLKYGKALINTEKFNELHASIQFENLGYYQAIITSEKFTSFVEDIQGAMLSSDFGSAFFMVRRLVELAAISYLAIWGETNPNLKWIYRKILRYQEHTGDKKLLENYLYFQTYPFDELTIKDFVKEAMMFSQSLNVKTQMALKNKQLS